MPTRMPIVFEELDHIAKNALIDYRSAETHHR